MNKTQFSTDNTMLNSLFKKAEELAKGNIRDFEGRKVLVEGAGYEKIWLETQPMGGEMYAKRDVETALNNQLLFMECQRKDGRLPGSIEHRPGEVIPQFNKLQGFCFPAPALNVYYLMGEDKEYLNLLGATLEKFDGWLWKYRDSDGDGCLESFCVYDTGEDGALRYGDAPNAWEDELPPEDSNIVPMASSDIMSWSYSARRHIAEVYKIKGNREGYEKWTGLADKIKMKTEEYLWNEERGAFFDRNKNHEMQNVLTHNTLKAMYWKNVDALKAERFVKEHLLNEKEFMTKMPLPSVSAGDALFRNIKENNWSGQCEALTYQRAIRALENYGFDYIVPVLGKRLFETVYNGMSFVQQFDPFTMEPSLNPGSGGSPTYGPCILAVLEYMARMYGIHREKKEIFWGGFNDIEGEYIQVYNDAEYKICHQNGRSIAYLDGKHVFESICSEKIITDLSGKCLKRIPFTV